jgi:hypothetical protein
MMKYEENDGTSKMKRTKHFINLIQTMRFHASEAVMTTILSKKQALRSSVLFLTFLATFLLSACGSDSGALNQARPDASNGSTASNIYDGDTTAATGDVEDFQEHIWTNLASQDRCGSCHNRSTGNQSPLFVDDQDINFAYAQVNSLVNLDDPALSLMVTKVAGGHNCWLTSDAACEDILTRYITSWAGGSAGAATEIILRAPAIKELGTTKNFPDDTSNYSTTIYPLLTQYCVDCHVEGLQTPFIASSDITTSYNGAKSKIDLQTPAGSRLVLRLRNEFHNCWDGNCTSASLAMEDAIKAFSDTIDTAEVDPELVTSKALLLIEDGLVANAGGRFEDHIIALYEFKEGEGTIANDTSGVEPAMNLNLFGNADWVGGWGIKIGPAYTDEETNISYDNGKAQGSTASSKKLHDQIKATGEYSIEAWVVPGNVAQENTPIVTYSGSEDARNFTLGQTLYNYDFYQRSSTTNQTEAMSTADADERLQANLQHVVVTYAPSEARKIYVNGEYTEDLDPETAGNLNEWDDSFAFVLGNEGSSNSLWQGTLRMVAIHNRSLTSEQIAQNYNVGVGEKFFLLFSVSHLTNTPESFIVFEVSQYDSFSYLFTAPYFKSLDPTASFSDIPVKGLKLGINGKEATIGQAFKNIDISLNDTDYENGGDQQSLSRLGTIIPLETGPSTDEFFLSFEQIGTFSNVIVEAEPSTPPTPLDDEPASDIGLKTFDEINVSMAVLTGVSKTNVSATFNTVKQQLPTVESISGFLSAHQMAVTQLAIKYCDALVEDTTLRADFFPSFVFTTSANTLFDPLRDALDALEEPYSTPIFDYSLDPVGLNSIINPLLTNFIGSNLDSQPSNDVVSDELMLLISKLAACSVDDSCENDRTETVVKATCAAVLGSATTLIQ